MKVRLIWVMLFFLDVTTLFSQSVYIDLKEKNLSYTFVYCQESNGEPVILLNILLHDNSLSYLSGTGNKFLVCFRLFKLQSLPPGIQNPKRKGASNLKSFLVQNTSRIREGQKEQSVPAVFNIMKQFINPFTPIRELIIQDTISNRVFIVGNKLEVKIFTLANTTVTSPFQSSSTVINELLPVVPPERKQFYIIPHFSLLYEPPTIATVPKADSLKGIPEKNLEYLSRNKMFLAKKNEGRHLYYFYTASYLKGAVNLMRPESVEEFIYRPGIGIIGIRLLEECPLVDRWREKQFSSEIIIREYLPMRIGDKPVRLIKWDGDWLE